MIRTFSFIRSLAADQMELYSDSLFLMPMLRRLEEDMNAIQLNPEHEQEAQRRRGFLDGQMEETNRRLKEVEYCLNAVKNFTLLAKTRV